ncbi:MAG: serine/threonine protein kinase [Deltaproteobacteria bacterium]|nr:serine/threonine protein kinase [Deltaproteobacteria bacterium]
MSTASAGSPRVSQPPPIPSRPGTPAPAGGAPVGPDGEQMPRRFGKYTLMRKLAVGGMAELFLALQRSVAGFEKLIVVKRILPHLAKDRAFIELILQEAKISATLNHPNICHIYDVGEAEGQFYIAMEHIHGEDLRSIVRQMKKVNETTFPVEHALAIVLGCCAGLAHAHEKTTLDGEAMNIVHRDVSPQNILVTFNGDVKLVDFGIAKAGRSSMEDTGSGQLKGKVPYMSPEQAQGQMLDGRSDIFSLGIILFELTTGRRLFRGNNEMDTLRMIVDGEYPKPRDLNPGIPEALEKIILRSLEKDTDKRYQSARQMQGELEDFIRAAQLKVSPLSAGEWMQRLFAEKLSTQKQMLAEGRQLADVIAAQVAAEEEAAAREAATMSGVRARQTSRAPWIALGVVGLLVAAAAIAVVLMQPSGPPVGPGVLVIQSTPPGAAISIDGARRSERTPATLRELPLAHYAVQVSSEGFVAQTREIDLTEGAPQATVEVTLERPSASSFGMANVTSTPVGAQILVDGTDVSQLTPFRVANLEPGIEHTIAVSLSGWVSQSRTVVLRAGQVEDLAFSLERTPLGPDEALLVLTTDPPDSRVQLDSTWYETGSPFEIRTSARQHRLRVTHEGRRMHEQDLRLPGAQQTELRVDLERERSSTGGTSGSGQQTTTGGGGNPAPSGPGTVTIAASPWCNVSIDGRAVGETPVVNHTLQSGRHTITCTNPELNVTRTRSVEIAAGENARVRIELQ